MPVKQRKLNPGAAVYTQDPGDTQRALLLAPLARDLLTEFPGLPLVKLPVASATQQVWDTNARQFFINLADPGITILLKRSDNTLTRAMKFALVRTWASDTSFPVTSAAVAFAGSTNGFYESPTNMAGTRWVAIRRSGVAMCIQKFAFVPATDRLIDQLTIPIHQFFGEDVAETQLGKDE